MSHRLGVPAVLLRGGFSDPWVAGWPGEGSYSRICLSHSHLPLKDTNMCMGAHDLHYRAPYKQHEHCWRWRSVQRLTFWQQQSHSFPRSTARSQQQRRVPFTINAIKVCTLRRESGSLIITLIWTHVTVISANKWDHGKTNNIYIKFYTALHVFVQPEWRLHGESIVPCFTVQNRRRVLFHGQTNTQTSPSFS